MKNSLSFLCAKKRGVKKEMEEKSKNIERKDKKEV